MMPISMPKGTGKAQKASNQHKEPEESENQKWEVIFLREEYTYWSSSPVSPKNIQTNNIIQTQLFLFRNIYVYIPTQIHICIQ